MIENGTLLQQRYRIERQIGQGGMGAVYIATDERFGSIVAIKETLCMDPNFRKAIEREARLLNSLKHAALPRVSDHFEESNSQFLVMEYITGEDVAAMIESDHAKFTPDQVLKWADQLLDALDYLHTQVVPVIHRDIKPQNLKINGRGDIILLDFGLAKGHATDAASSTAAQSIFGYSRSYASLEQIQGTGTDPRSDLYSLAATLYHLLTRVVPEDALTRAMSVLSKKDDPLVPAWQANSSVPKGISGVLQKALDLDAGERPASASEMRQMLRESDKYENLATVPSFGQARETQALSPETNVAVEATEVEPIKPTEMKTEVLPSFSSQETDVIRPALAARKTVARSAKPLAIPRIETTQPSRYALAPVLIVAAVVLTVVGGGLVLLKGSSGRGTVANPQTSASATAANSVDTNSAANAANGSVPDGGNASAAANANAVNAVGMPPVAQANQPGSAATTKVSTDETAKTTVDGAKPLSPDDPDTVEITRTDVNGIPSRVRIKRSQLVVPQPQQPQQQPVRERVEPDPDDYEPRDITPEQRRRIEDEVRRGLGEQPPFQPPPMPPRRPEN